MKRIISIVAALAAASTIADQLRSVGLGLPERPSGASLSSALDDESATAISAAVKQPLQRLKTDGAVSMPNLGER
jgi:hypothetical protein